MFTAGFAYGGGKGGKEGVSVMATLFGCGLLLISVLADAFLPNLQQKVMSKVRGTLPIESCVALPFSVT